jgi:hypothetical protein
MKNTYRGKLKKESKTKPSDREKVGSIPARRTSPLKLPPEPILARK